MFKTISIIFSIFIFLPGCATAPSSAPKFADVIVPAVSADKGVLVIFRKTTKPYLYNMRVDIDGAPTALLPNDTFSWVELSEGDHNITIDWPFISGMPSTSVPVSVVAGQTQYIELNSDVSVSMSVSLSSGASSSSVGGASGSNSGLILTKSEAVKELTECCQYVKLVTE